MARRSRLMHRLVVGLFCVGMPWLLGAQGGGAGEKEEEPSSFRPETPPAGSGGGGGVCESFPVRICPNKPTTQCTCGYICLDKDCLPAPPNCETDADCPSGACEGGKCRCDAFAEAKDCNPEVSDGHSYACSSGFCTQMPDQCVGEGTKCGEDGVCRRSQCYERCASDLVCPVGLVCKQNGLCGPRFEADDGAPRYTCATRGGTEGNGGAGAWMFALVAAMVGVRARGRWSAGGSRAA